MKLHLVDAGDFAVFVTRDRSGVFQALDVIYSASETEIRAALQWMHHILPAKGIRKKASSQVDDEIWRFRAWAGQPLHLYVFDDAEMPTAHGSLQAVVVAGADLLGSHGQRQTRGLEAAVEIYEDYQDAKLLRDLTIDKGIEPIGGGHVH